MRDYGYSIVTVEQQLLFDILAELEKISERICQAEPKEDLFEPLEKIEQLVGKTDILKELKICKACGKTHEKSWEYAVCSRNKKKEGTQ